jgi:hypothetical protein
MVATALDADPDRVVGELACALAREQITAAAAPLDTGQISNRRSGLLT